MKQRQVTRKKLTYLKKSIDIFFALVEQKPVRVGLLSNLYFGVFGIDSEFDKIPFIKIKI